MLGLLIPLGSRQNAAQRSEVIGPTIAYPSQDRFAGRTDHARKDESFRFRLLVNKGLGIHTADVCLLEFE